MAAQHTGGLLDGHFPAEQVGDAALLFDPFDVKEVASALARMTTDNNLREDLRQRGTRRLKDFSLENTAKAYRAVYRQTGKQQLSEEDRWLLAGGNDKPETRIEVRR